MEDVNAFCDEGGADLGGEELLAGGVSGKHKDRIAPKPCRDLNIGIEPVPDHEHMRGCHRVGPGSGF